MKKKKRIKISPIQGAVIVLMCFMVISIVFNIHESQRCEVLIQKYKVEHIARARQYNMITLLYKSVPIEWENAQNENSKLSDTKLVKTLDDAKEFNEKESKIGQ